MAGRYVLTPARRAALKKAQARSAAKRRGRKSYRQANRVASRKINRDFAKGKYTKPGVRGLGDALRGKPRKRAQAAYDRAKNDNAVKYKGKKRRSDRYLKNKRTAINGLVSAVAVTPYAASVYVGHKENKIRKATGGQYGYSDVRRVNKAHRKANKARNSANRAAAKRNLAGVHNPNKRSRKPIKVQSSRVSSGPLAISAAAPRRRKTNSARR